MWAIWDYSISDWVRELPSKVDGGGVAVLAFETRQYAQARAAKHFGCGYYDEARRQGWCEVRSMGNETSKEKV